MTVLIAQRTKDRIILGADTACFYGYNKRNLIQHKGRLKIVSINDITYSACGSVAETVNFGLFCQTRKPERADQCGMQRFFNDFGKWLKDNVLGREKIEIQNNYFIVFEKTLFHYWDGAVREIVENDFDADGAGREEAYMLMYIGKSVKEAIELTIERNVWAGGQAQIVEIMLTNSEKPVPPPPPPPQPGPIEERSL